MPWASLMGHEGLAWSSVMLRSQDCGAVMGGRAKRREMGGAIVVVSSVSSLGLLSWVEERGEGRLYCWTRASILVVVVGARWKVRRWVFVVWEKGGGFGSLKLFGVSRQASKPASPI